MKKLTLCLMMLFSKSIAMENSNCTQLKTKIEARAKEFASERTSTSDGLHYWRLAYTAYALDKIKNEKESLDEILSVGKEIHNSQSPFRTWDDNKIRSYFNQSIDDWDKVNKSVEDNWKVVCNCLKQNK